jgi:hypothetical protein
MHRGPAIGWYADPDKTNWERYWDREARKRLRPFQRFFVGLQAIFLVTVVALLIWVFTLQCDGGDRVCSAEQEARGMALVFVTGCGSSSMPPS